MDCAARTGRPAAAAIVVAPWGDTAGRGDHPAVRIGLGALLHAAEAGLAADRPVLQAA